MYGHAIFPRLNALLPYTGFSFPMGIPSKLSKISNPERGNNIIKCDPQNFFLNQIKNDQEDNYEINYDEIKNDRINIRQYFCLKRLLNTKGLHFFLLKKIFQIYL